MKLTNILYVLTRLCFINAACFFLPLAFSFYYKDGQLYLLSFHIIGLALLGLPSLFFKAKPAELSTRDGFLIVSLAWICLATFGSMPFVISGAIPSFTDAFFETMSGFTTTGASILNDIEALPKSLQLWRHMTQWLGGMGVIALAVAVFPFLGVGGVQLFKAEVPGPIKDKISPRISKTAKILWLIYLLFTVVQIVLLMIGGLSFFDAMCITFATMATGGFAPLNASIAGYPSAYIQYVIVIFMFIAGTNFSLHYWAIKGNPIRYFKNAEFIFFGAVVLCAFAVITCIRLLYGANFSEDLLRSTIFQTVSIITTTGFVTQDYEIWPFATQFILLILMFFGGCAGSTGGGIKIIRIHALFKYLASEMKRLFYPRGVFPVKIQNTLIPENTVSNIIAFILLYLLLFASGVFAMTILGENIDTAIGSVAATLGNVGPGIGNVGPVENYSNISTTGKWILSFLMMAGRLEIYTVLVLFMPDFWR